MVTVPVEATWVEFDVSGSPSTGPFSFGFPYFAKADLDVRVDGTRLTTSQFTDTPGSGSATAGYDGGSVTLNTAAAVGAKVSIARDTTAERTANLSGGGMTPTALDAALNKSMMLHQEHKRDIDRAVKFPVDEAADFTLPAAASRANKILAFDASGNVTYLPDAGPAAFQAYVDAEVEIFSVDTVAQARALTPGEYNAVAINTSMTTVGDFGASVNVFDVELWRWDADSKEADDGYKFLKPDSIAATAAGRLVRSTVMDQGTGDTPKPLPCHLREIYGHLDGQALSRGLVEQRLNTPAGFNGFSVPTSGSQTVPQQTYYYAFWGAESFDTIGAYDFTTSAAIFTANRDCIINVAVALEMSKTYSATASVELELVKLGVQGAAKTIESFDWNNSRVEVEIDSHGFVAGNVVSIAGLTTNTSYNGRLFVIANTMAISGVALNNPLELTITGHGFQTGQQITVTGVVGTTELNGNTYTITSTGANTVTLDGVDGTSGFTAYTSGGTAANLDMFWLSGITASGSTAETAISTADTSGEARFEGANGSLASIAKGRDESDNDAIFSTKVQRVMSDWVSLNAGERLALRLYNSDGSNAATIVASTGNRISAQCGFIDPAINEFGRNLAIIQGEIQNLYRTNDDAITDLYRFDHLIFSGVETVSDSASLSWPVDTESGFGFFSGLYSTKYPNQRQLVRGVRAKNERQLVWGYVSATADAPAGSYSGYGLDTIEGLSMGTRSVTGATAALNLTTGVTTVTKASHGFSDGDVVFLSGFTEMTHLNNRTFRIDYVDANSFILQDYLNGSKASPVSSTPVAISDITVEGDGKVRVTTSSAHGLSTGDVCSIYGTIPFTFPYIGQAGVQVERISNTQVYLKNNLGAYIDGSAHDAYVSGGYIGRFAYINPVAFAETTGGTVRDYWSLDDRPTANNLRNLKYWCNLWREDGVDGLFIDLVNSQWITTAIRDEVFRVVKAFGFRIMANMTTGSAAAVDFILDSKHFGRGDYVYIEGATQQGTEDRSSQTTAAITAFDARKWRGAHIAFHYTEYEGAKRSISAATQANPCQITFSENHGFETGDTIVFGLVNGMTEINYTAANSNPTYKVVRVSDTVITLQNSAGAAIDSSGYGAFSSSPDGWATLTTSVFTITGATQANPVVITTSANHGFITGDTVRINRVNGMTELNGKNFTVTRISAKTFSIGVDGTTYNAFSASPLSTVAVTEGVNTSSVRYGNFKSLVDGRTGAAGRDAAGASTTGLGIFTRNLPVYEEDWEPIGGP